jgi:PAS domain S-box-containing protein
LASLFTRFGKGETLEAADITFRASGKEIQALSQAFRDMLTERAKSEAQMRLAGSVFENTQEGIFVTDSQGRILSANAAFSDITGYGMEETIDNSTDILKPAGQDAAFYEACWSAAREDGHWQGEIWNRRKNGEEFPAWQAISAVRDEGGEISNYVSVFSDITDKKNAEKRIAHLAYHDALTQLPNRLLLYERVEQALARARRHGDHLALLFLDLDLPD